MKKFILVDDDQIFNFIHQKIIQQACPDAVIEVYQSSVDALNALNQQLKAEHNACTTLFLDINMPEINGFELLDQLHAHFPNEKLIDVFMVSSTLNEKDIEKALSYPCVKGFKSKPLKKEDVAVLCGC